MTYQWKGESFSATSRTYSAEKCLKSVDMQDDELIKINEWKNGIYLLDIFMDDD